ncbi:MAG: adenylate kinase family protein [Candidatus Thermoplasmatota archaeon]|nr:adenylate kinase family protein [Candidatus Thermoplasmatota archaeon]
MIIALTGTPGTGKTSASKVLEENDFEVVDLNKIAIEKGFSVGKDKNRNSKIIDIERLNNYIKEEYSKKDIVFIEGHLSHLLKSVDKVIVLRCHPNELRKRLSHKGWRKEKIKENIEAEMLDIILCETADIHSEKNIFEIDTTGEPTKDVARSVMKITKNGFRRMKGYNIGNIDWSEEILKDFK